MKYTEDDNKVRFLIIRFSSIGDIVLTTPVVRCLKQQVENAEVHYLTKPANVNMLKANPYIDKVHTYISYKETAKDLRAENFDYIIDLQKNARSYRISRMLKRLSYSFPKLNFQKWLMTAFKINRLPNVHIVDRYFEAVRLFDVKNDMQGLDFFIPPSDEVDVMSLFGQQHGTYVAYAIGGQHATKRMPAEKIAEVCAKIEQKVVLLGGPSDEEVAKLICSRCDNCINLCGKLSLSQSASVVKQAQRVITHDTGLMHIAAAFKKDIISVWGNTIPEFGMTPYLAGERSRIVEVKDCKCRPCSKLGYEKCPMSHFNCMNCQNAEEIASW